ncbi:MAG: desulfoferrodoxin family protein, partial [Candidatus Parabeggiatoa sp.]|nr:desulfoferrodoxin family protein [Candidatus Parabeggiatoa sp.]
TSGSGALPSNIVYTADDPGQWAKKVGGHLPKVSIQGKTVTITTDHPMMKYHYIVRHTLVSEEGTVIGGKVFQPEDEAVSQFELPEGHGSKFYATSFCNKHDLWVAEVTV